MSSPRSLLRRCLLSLESSGKSTSGVHVYFPFSSLDVTCHRPRVTLSRAAMPRVTLSRAASKVAHYICRINTTLFLTPLTFSGISENVNRFQGRALTFVSAKLGRRDSLFWFVNYLILYIFTVLIPRIGSAWIKQLHNFYLPKSQQRISVGTARVLGWDAHTPSYTRSYAYIHMFRVWNFDACAAGSLMMFFIHKWVIP